MSETTQSIFANSFQIAWDYLEATGEIGNPDRTASHLLDTIEAMIGMAKGDRSFSPIKRLPPTSASERSRD
jgi:hypothetical protein